MNREFAANVKKPLILIVDDTPANLQLLADILKQKGYDVRVAPSGQLALDFIQRTTPDLILLDIAMPQMDGYEVCRRLKANTKWRVIPVIFISALEEEQAIIRSFKAGGVDYISKPFRSAEVEARVETHLNLYRSQIFLESLVQEKVREISTTIERMKKAEKFGMLGVISSGIAHEINQPLNVLKMRADSLLYWADNGNMPPVDEMLQDIRIISKCAGQIGDIIQHMRTLSREQRPDYTEDCRLFATIHSALNMMRSRLIEHGIQVIIEQEVPEAIVKMNAVQMEQIILNLLSNSLQALKEANHTEKKILISYQPTADWVTLEVADNGPGIPITVREQIFEPFYSTGKAEENMGFGLSICKKIVQSYGGEIWATDNAMGGASIIVKLPITAENEKDRDVK